jgi:DNA-binding beta-propeller fold protein YncE
MLLVPGALAQPPVVPRFPNVPQTPGAILSGLNAPNQGRTAIIAYHNGVLFTVPELPASQPGSDGQVRTWDLTNPAAPVQMATLGVTPMPVNAHGYLSSGDYLVLGANWPPEAPWSFQATGTFGTTRTSYPDLLCAGVRGCLFAPWFVGDTWWSYGTISGNATISRNWNEFASWDHLGLTGVIGHPFLLGDLLIFAADQSRTGVATYDVSNPANPVLLDVLNTGGPGGYWPELWGGDGKLYIVFPYQTGGNGFRVVDATDPSNLTFVTDRPLSGDESMYAQFQDDYAFMGSHKVDMRTFESVLNLNGANTVRPNDGGTGINTSQFALPLGNLLVTGGIGPNQGMAIWAHQAAPDTRGPSVGFHIPRAGRTNYPLGAPISLLIHETLETKTIVNGTTFIVRPLGGSAIAGRLTFSFDDVLTFTPNQPLLANTTYEVVLPAGGIKDAAGNGMVGYSFTFSTGGSVGGNAAPQITSLTSSQHPVPPGQSATVTAVATDPNGGPLELRFDFGDGSAKTPWSASTSANHSWSAPGHYRVTAQVRDAAGALGSSSTTVTVLTAPAGPKPTSSSAVVVDAANGRVWSVNQDADTVAAVDAGNASLEMEVPVCAEPQSLALSAAGQLWVACARGDRVRVLDASSGGLIADIPTGYGSAPAGVAFNPAGTTAFVTLSGAGRLLRIDAVTRQTTGDLALGPGPRALAVSANGSRVFVTRFLSPRDWAEVWEVSASAMTLTRTVRIPKAGGDANRDGTASGRGTLNYLTGIAISLDGTSAWVVGTKPNTERGLLIGPDLDSDNTVRAMVAELDLVANGFLRSIDVDNSDSPTALALSPLGDYLFVTLQGADAVTVLDTLLMDVAAGLGSFVTRLATGAAPRGVAVDPATGRTFVHDFMGRSVTVLETEALFERGDRTVAASTVETVADEPLPLQVAHGKRLFYHAADTRISAEGYLSCGTCHVDGGHDGRVFDFTGRGEGLRNTTDLRGRAGVAQGNVHWSANFDEIQDFENDMRNAFGGSGLMDDDDFAATAAPLGSPKAGLSADLDALAAYVASLGADHLPKSPFRNADGSMTAAGAAGRQVFRTQGCAGCHAGPGSPTAGWGRTRCSTTSGRCAPPRAGDWAARSLESTRRRCAAPGTPRPTSTTARRRPSTPSSRWAAAR